MIKKAYVQEVTDSGKAVLKVKRECACGGNESCNMKCFSLQSDVIEVTVENEIGAKSGDYVELEGKTSAILIYSAVVFVLPVFIGLTLYFIAQLFTESEFLPYIVSGIGFLLSVVFLYFFLNRVAKRRKDFKITRII